MTIPQSVRILIGSTPIDMRKSIDGLTAIVQEELRENAYSGHLFVFVSRRCDRVKILAWDKGGFVLVYKRLERGRFKLPHMDPSMSRWPSRSTPRSCCRARWLMDSRTAWLVSTTPMREPRAAA